MTISHLQACAARCLFEGVTAASGRRYIAAAVEVTAIEVAGRSCRDLHSGSVCTVLQTKAGGAELKGAVPFVATSGAALAAHLERVLKTRRTEATAVNSTSSRSHALLTLRVGVDGGAVHVSRLPPPVWSPPPGPQASRSRKASSQTAIDRWGGGRVELR